MQHDLVAYQFVTNVFVGQDSVQYCTQGLILHIQCHELPQVKGRVAIRYPHPVLPPQRTQHRFEWCLIEYHGYFAVEYRTRANLGGNQLASQQKKDGYGQAYAGWHSKSRVKSR